jgi:hypothetical protein
LQSSTRSSSSFPAWLWQTQEDPPELIAAEARLAELEAKKPQENEELEGDFAIQKSSLQYYPQ